MAGLIGSGGRVNLTIGGQQKPIGELLRFRIDMTRNRLDTTTQADEDTTLTGGRRSFRGTFEFRTRFFDDDVCWSTYQLIEHLLENEDDAVLLDAEFRMQDEGQSCGDYRDQIYMTGQIIADLSIDLRYDAPVASVGTWQASGPMKLERRSA